MNKSIQDWQKSLGDAIDKKFPNNASWTQKDRLLAIQRQLADLGGAIQKEEGILVSHSHSHDDVDHQIACVLVDLLKLAQTRQTDLDAELQKCLNWLNAPETKPSLD